MKSGKLVLESFDADGLSDTVDASFTGHFLLNYDGEGSYELVSAFSATPDDQRWVGERLTNPERFSFYYAGASTEGAMGETRGQARIELRFMGKDLFIAETWVPTAQGEVRVQSYRFTRGS